MDYLQKMNDALDYIESNLDGDIDYEKASNLACCSIFYFQRMFSFIADVTLSEYIRRRRMTLAAFELQNSSVKIIDLAIKYGYESSDAFSRAFQNLHGVIPSKARNTGVSLKAFPRIAFQISIRGDVEMRYRIEKREELRIVGVKRNFKTPDESGDVVPKFWNEIFINGSFEKLSNLSTGNPKGVHGFIKVLGEDEVEYTIACITNKEVPKDMIIEVIPQSTWAIFEFTGSVNTEIADGWKRIFTEWLPTSNYKYLGKTDIECFPHSGNRQDSNFKFEIWISVEKNNDI